MISWLWKGKKEPSVPSMTLEDQATIEAFAQGDESLRPHAIRAYRRTPVLGHGQNGISHYLFMREVDTVAPDLSWRAIQRERLLKDIRDRDGIS